MGVISGILALLLFGILLIPSILVIVYYACVPKRLNEIASELKRIANSLEK